MDISYFAGFFDADGSVGIQQSRDKYFILFCVVYNSNKKVLELFKEKFGGSIHVSHNHPEKNWKKGYRWVVASRMAQDFLSRIYQSLIVKRDRVELGIRFQSLQGKHNSHGTILQRDEKGRIKKGGKRTCDEKHREKLRGFYQRMKKLNQRGLFIK